MAVPVTSVSLLKVLGEDAQSPRWTEFAKKYDGKFFVEHKKLEDNPHGKS